MLKIPTFTSVLHSQLDSVDIVSIGRQRVPLTDFFNDPDVIAYQGIHKEMSMLAECIPLSRLFKKKDVIFTSETMIEAADYTINDNKLYRSHFSKIEDIASCGLKRNDYIDSESFDDYLTKLMEHTAGHGSTGGVLSFSSKKRSARKFLSEEKKIVTIQVPRGVGQYDFISTPQLILQHSGRLLKAGKIDYCTILKALDQLNNKEYEFFYIGKSIGCEYGEIPAHMIDKVEWDKSCMLRKQFSFSGK